MPIKDKHKVNDTMAEPFDIARSFQNTQPPLPDWKFGDGASTPADANNGQMIEIDPSFPGRQTKDNYRLLIGTILPRPIALVSTISATDSRPNLAPFSYFNVVSHDPPVFVIGFAGGSAHAKDSLKNLVETKECTINIVSEHMLQAANACSINTPYGVSEWDVSGLTPAPSTSVKPSRVAESRFAVEGQLLEIKEFESRSSPGKSNSAMAVIEGVKFWVWRREGQEGEEKTDVSDLRPVSRLGGITYARVLDGVSIPRPSYEGTSKG